MEILYKKVLLANNFNEWPFNNLMTKSYLSNKL